MNADEIASLIAALHAASRKAA